MDHPDFRREAPPTLLIVDDNQAFRAFARRLLEGEGLAVVGEAADGETALHLAKELRPDIVLLDVVLPDLDGFSVCAALTSRLPSPAVVMTSSRASSAYRRRIAASNARGFLPKSELSGDAVTALVG
jgi:DNA-binding NarL/FixJ family response regulator